ncbi:hypothetical protein HYW21_04085 [Candidatus Woesearchaeota archaeon]|nr:hypothetical protein [Candidatus Woesearchaeota archaeon]
MAFWWMEDPAQEPASWTLLAAKWRVRHIGILNLKEFYRMMHDWFVELEYGTFEDKKFAESLMWEERSQQYGRTIWFWWRGKFIPQKSSFHRRALHIECNCVNIQDKEIIREGKKYKVQSGEVNVYCKSILESDYTGAWKKNWLMKNLQEIYWRRMVHRTFQEHRLRVMEDADNLKETVKQFFNLTLWEERPKAFFPPKAITRLGDTARE